MTDEAPKNELAVVDAALDISVEGGGRLHADHAGLCTTAQQAEGQSR